MQQRVMNKVTAPIARSTAYDFNCHLPKCHIRPADQRRGGVGVHDNDENVSVMPHELLFACNDKHTSASRRMHAMSSLNGYVFTKQAHDDIVEAVRRHHPTASNYSSIYTPPKDVKYSDLSASQAKAINRSLNKYIRYVGVAVTGCGGGPSNALQRQGYSATRGGLVTVIHTGEEIPAGAKIAMEIDCRCLFADHRRAVHATGVPKDKILANLVEVKDDEDLFDIDRTPTSYHLRGNGHMSFGKYDVRVVPAA